MENQIKHPMVQYGERRGWGYSTTAEHFGISHGTFRQYVTGWSGVSWRKAQLWAAASGGEFSATDVMLWHQKHRKMTGEPKPAA